MLKRLSISLVLSLLAFLLFYMAIQVQPTKELPPTWVAREVESFSARLGIEPPTIQYAQFDGIAFIDCNGPHGHCSLSLGRQFNSSGWQTKSQESMALLGHELGHVYQDRQGRSRRFDPNDLLLLFVVFSVLVVQVTPFQRAATLGLIACVAGICWLLDFISFDQVIPLLLLSAVLLTVAATLSGFFMAAFSGTKEYRVLGRQAASLAFVISLSGVTWINLREFAGAGQIPLEYEADAISACLTSSSSLVAMETKSSGSTAHDKPFLKPIYHPSYQDRVKAMTTHQEQKCASW